MSFWCPPGGRQNTEQTPSHVWFALITARWEMQYRFKAKTTRFITRHFVAVILNNAITCSDRELYCDLSCAHKKAFLLCTWIYNLLLFLFIIAFFIAILNGINLSFNFGRGFACCSTNPTASDWQAKGGDQRCCKNPHAKFHPKLRVVLTDCLVYVAVILSDALFNK